MKKGSHRSIAKCILFGQTRSWREAIDTAKAQAGGSGVTGEAIRERIRDEDSLLNARTNIFLVVNGIGLLAVGLSRPMLSPVLLCSLMALVDLLWFLCSRQSVALLSALTKLLRSVAPHEVVETLVQDVLGGGRKHWFRPATILAVYLPLFKFVVWVGCGVSLLIPG